MKNLSLIVVVCLFLALGCTHDDVTLPFEKGAPPVNHAKVKHPSNANARLSGCINAWCAFTVPNAYASLFSTFATVFKPDLLNLQWRTSSSGPPNNFVGFPVNIYPNVTLSLYGPAPNYPLVSSQTIANNTNVTYGGNYYGATTYYVGNVPTGWYYFLIESGTDNNCQNSAVDLYLRDY